ncbi:hypothetical protein CRUP_036252 [Coryphaenoides rupestris]|nr:hypothetical protein CRUP_036252 [Coryphaenoides rupestris]
MFPFYYKDRWFEDCTSYDSPNNKPWCSIGTRTENERWGYCPSTNTQTWKKNIITGALYQINVQSALSWDQAYASCKQQGTSLVSITDPNEQAFIIVLMGGNQNRLWIGLTIDHEHGWQWADGKPYRYLRWDDGHPLPNPGHQCAIMDSSVQYAWQTIACSKRLGYVCYKGGSQPLPTEVEAGFCPSPWIPYNGHCFNLNRTRKTWKEAQTECAKVGGDLASMSNIEDKSFVISQLGYASKDELWIGLNDRKTEGLFDWSDHSTVYFTSWERGSPHVNGYHEDCVLIRGESGNWADRTCVEKHGYICMRTTDTDSTGDEVLVDLGCKPGWRRHGSYCYLIGSATKTFDEANEECKNTNSYMADVSNGVDNAFLVSLLGLRSEKYFWLGLSNQRNIEVFVWTTSNHVRFTHWNADMPARLQGCVAMTTGVYPGLWDVLPCTNQEKFVCKHLAEGAVLTVAPPTVPNPKCENGWKPLGSRNMCFKFFTGPRSGEKTWYESRDYCRAIGGDLMSIHSQQELSTGSHGKAWIGLSEPTPGAGYEWSDGTPLNYLHWVSGEPNNKGSIESCAEFRMYYWDESGSWNDVHCETYNDWLCEIRAGVVPKPPPNDTVTEYNRTSDGWLEWGGNQYYFKHQVQPMEEARHYCKQRHGDLVVINSEAENVFLWKMVSRNYGYFYIGMYVDFDQSFGWMDGSPVNFQRWDENQPDFKNNDENCVAMTHHSGFWHDTNCGTEYQSICKRSSSSPVNTTAAPTEAPKGGCQSDWMKFESKCYRIVQTRKDKWSEARSRCTTMGGNLASISSRGEQVFLMIRMAEVSSTDLWIGLNSLDKGAFFWTDGRPRRYTNWGFSRHRGHASFHSSWSDDGCVIISSNRTKYGKWITQNCNETNAYVCQRNVDSNIPMVEEQLTPTIYLKVANDSVKIVTQNMTWKQARERCQADGAQLASIRNEWARAYIELQAIKLNSPLWIGLNKNETSGYFRFISGWHLISANWAPDVPPTESSEFPGNCPGATHSERSSQSYAWMPFKSHCYVFIPETVEWADAASDCSRHGGGLASIENPEEQAFVEAQVKELADGQNSFWIGLFKSHSDYQVGEKKRRAHTSLAVVMSLCFLCAMAALALFLYKKSGRSLPTFENPLYFAGERPQPDLVDTNKLIENAEQEGEEEEPAPIIML